MTVQMMYHIKLDSLGHFVSLEPVDTMQQMDNDMTDNLSHVGVLGMRWGHRKAARDTVGEKAGLILKNKSVKGTTDYARFKYRSDPLATRITKTAAGVVKQQVTRHVLIYMLNYMLTGKLPNFNPTKMSKVDFARSALKFSSKVAKTVAVQDLLANSAAKRYDSKGKHIKGKWHGNKLGISREDAAQVALNTAIALVPFAGAIVGLKIKDMAAKHRNARETFEKWGANILPEKVDNVVWQSEDGLTSVIEND